MEPLAVARRIPERMPGRRRQLSARLGQPCFGLAGQHPRAAMMGAPPPQAMLGSAQEALYGASGATRCRPTSTRRQVTAAAATVTRGQGSR